MAFLALKFSRRMAVILVLSLFSAILVGQGLRAAGQRVAQTALVGRVIVVDAGHGGVDPGTVGPGGILEKDIVLDIALRLQDLLEKAGAKVVMTRTTDTDVSGYEDPWHPNRYKKDIYRRAEIVEETSPDVLISIHANADRSPSSYGAQVFYRPDSLGQNKRLAETIQGELKALVDGARPNTSDDIRQFILEKSPVPAATVEVGFLSNSREARLLNTPDYRGRVAWAIFIGLARYFLESDRLAGIGAEAL